MGKHVSIVEARFAVETALEGHKWFLYRWQGEYGDKYEKKDGTNPVRDMRVKDIQEEIDRLKAFKKAIS